MKHLNSMPEVIREDTGNTYLIYTDLTVAPLTDLHLTKRKLFGYKVEGVVDFISKEMLRDLKKVSKGLRVQELNVTLQGKTILRWEADGVVWNPYTLFLELQNDIETLSVQTPIAQFYGGEGTSLYPILEKLSDMGIKEAVVVEVSPTYEEVERYILTTIPKEKSNVQHTNSDKHE